MSSFTEENYIKSIYKLANYSKQVVTTNAIAEELNTKAASVTDMLKKLDAKKLVLYTKYQGVSLSEKGIKMAIGILRRHRLWEVFLVEKLNLKWDQVHEIAEELEHVDSDLLIKELDRFLGYPKFDPHGDPIPSSSLVFDQNNFILLKDLKLKTPALISGVKDHSVSFLQFLEKQELTLGKKILILEENEFDNSLWIELEKKQKLLLSREIANNILVSKL